jgi:hypothetical protein
MSLRRLQNFVLLLVAVVELGGILQAAAPRWRWSNPAPHGSHIYGIATRGSLVAQVGEFGQLYTSDDLDTWTPEKTGVTNALRSAAWFGSRLIVTGSEGTFLYSDDASTFTAISMGTSDWIEGVAVSPNRLAAVGDNGAIFTSVTGTNWTRLPDAPEWLRGVAYGGGKFVAVGEAGFVTVSVDGVTWEAAPRPTTKDLNRVRWLIDRFWLAGNGGLVMTSLDGANWSTINVGTTNDLLDVATDGQEWAVVGRLELRTSAPPFALWTQRAGFSPAPPPWTYYCAVWDGSQFLVGGRSGMLVEGYRPAGEPTTGWYPNSNSARNWIWSLTRVGGMYVACGEKGSVFTSVDGYRFDLEATPFGTQSEILEGIGGTEDLLVAVGTSGTVLWSPGGYTNTITTNAVGEVKTNQVSLLGLTWNASAKKTFNELEGIGVFGTTFIASGGQGTILTSPNGKDWTLQSSGVSRMLSSVTASPSRAVITGDQGVVLTSEDSVNWTLRDAGVTTNWISQARFLNSQFVGVGEAGLIITSPDGISWTRRDSGSTRWLNAVAFESGNYYAVGGQGTILQSPDAVAWTPIEIGTTKSLYGLAGENGQLVVAGLEGAALRTRLTPQTTPVNFLRYGVQTNANAFLFTGELDQRFVLERTSNYTNWSTLGELEMLDNSGALLHYNAIGRGNFWIYRTRLAEP